MDNLDAQSLNFAERSVRVCRPFTLFEGTTGTATERGEYTTSSRKSFIHVSYESGFSKSFIHVSYKKHRGIPPGVPK
jgi:hypothetical protein